MKKACLLIIVTMGVLLCFAPMGWAGEASVFDNGQNILIRAFTTASGAGPTYSAYLEAWDSDGVRFVCGDLSVTKLANGSGAVDEPCQDDTFLVHDNNLTSPDISMSFDSSNGGTTYVFCTEAPPDGLHMMKFRVALVGPSVTGVCGTTNNACTTGTLNDITDSGTNYLWNCTGSNGGTDASCSLPKPVNGVCGATNNACTTGTLNDITDSGTNYLWNCTGSNGGTDASCSLPKPVNGVCGATNNACTTGTLNNIADSGTNYLWECTGSNGGTTASCSAPIPTGSPDLIVVSMTGISSSYEYGGSFIVNWSVRNQGTGPSGPFTVKLYQNGSKAMGGSLLFTESVSGLAAGQSTGGTKSVATTAICSIHVYCYFNLWADADNQVAESNETNNEKSGQSERAR